MNIQKSICGKKTWHLHGFTLVEVLIVVVILGILAATVLPQFTASSEDAKESAILQDLQTLRSQIEMYRFQHLGVVPAASSTLPQDFINDMVLSSDADGTTGPVGTKPFGPYFLGQLPPNPFNGLRTLQMTAADLSTVTPDGATGWIYNTANGQIKANSLATVLASDGTPIHQL